jgi:tetratricopeptide (TPR) repeat protein
VYAGRSDHPFQYDDLHSIAENPHIRALANTPRYFVEPALFSADPRNAMYRPLVLVSYALNYALSGYEVWSYHLLNLGIHLGASGLVYALVCQMGGGGLRALLAGLIFALHPLGSEPVNYISSRSESLCAFFFLLAFLGHLRGGRRWFGVSLAACCGALLAKSVGIALLPVILAYDLIFRRAGCGWRYLLRRHLPFWLAGLAYLAGIRGAIDAAVVSHPVRSLAVQGFTQAKAVVYYLKLLCMPWGLSVEHPFVLASGLGDAPVLIALAGLGSASALLFLWSGRQALFWGAWAGLTLLPSSAVPLNVLVNEHRLYLPAAAFAVLLAGGLAELAEARGRLGVVLLAVWLGSYGALAWQRSQVWQSPETLWRDALLKGPRMPRPHLFLGDGHQAAGRYEEALREYHLARAVYPEVLSAGDLLISYNNQGAAHLALGRRNEAMESYRQALAIDPGYAKSRDALDALVALQELAWDPAARALHQQGLMSLIGNRPAEAVSALEQSLRRQVRLETYRALGMAYEQLGQVEQARQTYAAMKVLAPGSPFGKGAEEKLRQMEGIR